MRWKRTARSIGSGGIGCLNELFMYVVVTPVLGLVLAGAWFLGDAVLIVCAIVAAVLVFALYLLASWD